MTARKYFCADKGPTFSTHIFRMMWSTVINTGHYFIENSHHCSLRLLCDGRQHSILYCSSLLWISVQALFFFRCILQLILGF